MRGRVVRWAIAGLLVAASGMAQAAGSWVAEVPSVRAAVIGRETASEALVAPSGTQGRIREVRWRFRVPPGKGWRGRLCHPAGCVALHTARGRSEALAGLSADAPLRFRFSPMAGQAPLVVEGLQVIVNFQ
ncbi:flagellar protein FlhE [Halomonas organivorans]|uniref:Flagellar protein FlhE n=1 Tax=Halomonas organivorans TaxID=257772 RepID=A0A7W5BWG2_9GAMM|nr:flagellar protein FlhE [Halomonas organivorans]MBB3140412.1 flagellar protein FlhE [Halomonas organivorans]